MPRKVSQLPAVEAEMSTGRVGLEDGGVLRMASAIRSGLHRASQQLLATPTRQADAALGDLVSTALAELPCAWALITGQDEEVRVRVDRGLATLGAPDQEWYFLLQAVSKAGTVWAGQVPGGHGIIKGSAHLWYGAVLLPGPSRLVAVAAADEPLRDTALAALLGLAGLITAYQGSRGGSGQSLTAGELFADLGADRLAARGNQSIETLAREHLQAFQRHVPFDFAALFSVHGSQAVLSAVLDSQEGPGLGSPVVPLGASPLLQVAVATQRYLTLRDVESHPHWSALPFVAPHVRTAVVLPAILGDQTPGVVLLGWRAPADVAQVDLQLAAGFGRWLAAVLLHARGLAADQAVAMLSLTVPVADAPAGELGSPSLLGSFLGSVRQLMACDGVAVCAWRDGRPHLEAALGMTLSEDAPKGPAPPRGDPFVVTPGVPRWVNIGQAACTPVLTETGETPAALLLIPLAEDEGFLRSIVLAYQDPRWPTAERFALAEGVGRYTLSLLHGDRLTDQLFRRYRLQAQLQELDGLEAAIATVSDEVERRLRPVVDALQRLQTVPGIGERTAQLLLTEIGADMSRFGSAAHLASWAGLCPGNHESAGKRTSGRTRKGSPWLRTGLVEAARAASHTQGYLAAEYHRLAARRGAQRAALAVAHSLLVICYFLLRDGRTYEDLGGTYFEERNKEAVQRRLVRRLEALGCKVHLEPAA
ncbi:MAG: transposase [Chloroflexi bacterium]|nr:transposase [Chloroflexota bacterium]